MLRLMSTGSVIAQSGRDDRPRAGCAAWHGIVCSKRHMAHALWSQVCLGARGICNAAARRYAADARSSTTVADERC
jgi:hypothetical protein